ncbi:MAG: DUF1566 domain-containing protein [Candidatus Lokiarchaeota archaeon]|nr:DUF1566 domain-containing protein [Candidatus Lokiarchaeota archaeon]
MTYTVMDTGQTNCYNNLQEITFPSEDDEFFGQDAQYQTVVMDYQDNGDGTVTDLNTKLMWQKSVEEKVVFDDALSNAETFDLAGYTDWRLPTIKELYSLIDFNGKTGMSVEDSTPYINTDYFEFEYGDESIGERYIDAQWCSSTEYVSTTMDGDHTVFGVNFADGRIKGYSTEMLGGEEKKFFIRYVRGNTQYGINEFTDNADGTISDQTTGLMWSKNDSVTGMNWEDALAYAQQMNAENYLGYDDWRLPDAKELQSIVDYSRSPDITNSASINSVFNCTRITDEGGNDNYGFYWTSTTHLDGPDASGAVYIAFGEALGWMEVGGEYVLYDVHGAGAQRSDPKTGDASDYPHGFGPQGDVRRIENFVRLVRGGTYQELIEEPTANNLDMNTIILVAIPLCVVTIVAIVSHLKRRRE